jgi:hypothetical protein
MVLTPSKAQGRSPARAPRSLRALTVLVGLYLLGIGFLLGTINERILFDGRRDAILRPYEEALNQWHSHLMARPAKDQALGGSSTRRDSSGGFDESQNLSTGRKQREAEAGARPPSRRGSWED